MKIFSPTILLFALLLCFVSPSIGEVPTTFKYQSFREIPGVTLEETQAIEELQRRGEPLVYGMLPSTEAFLARDGEIKGFASLFCELLSELFDIPFKLKLYEWDDLIADLESGKVAFSGELTATEERRKTYIMTDPIAIRSVMLFRLAGSQPIKDIAAYRQLRYAFLEGTTTYDEVKASSVEQYEAFFVGNYEEAYSLLRDQKIDAFFEESSAESVFDVYENIVSEHFFPIIYSDVSMTTQTPALAPIISVVQKLLKNGGERHLVELYNIGHQSYLKNKLFKSLSEEELAYMQSHSIIPLLAEYDNYPTSFYNSREKEWQGISFDVLKEIETLTGLSFEVINNQNTAWNDLMDMLERGKGSMVTELIRTREREGRFLWPTSTLAQDNYALLSKADFKDINFNEILYMKVGVTKGIAYAEMFKKWFPNHTNVVEFEGSDLLFDALEKGDIDLAMSGNNQLLFLTNYRELPGFKINVQFNYPFTSTFGFYKGDSLLCNIVDKTLKLIDTKIISDRWTRKTYDYRIKLAEEKIPLFISIGTLLFCVLILVLILMFRSRNEGKRLEKEVQARTVELAEANRVKSDFLSKMSHELRTPLNAILGMTELCMREELSAQVREYMQTIKESGNKQLSLVDDILDFQKTQKIGAGIMDRVSAGKTKITRYIRSQSKHPILLLFIFSSVVMFLSSFGAGYFARSSLRTMEYNIEQRLISLATYLADFVDTEELDKYQEEADMELQSYKELRHKLRNFSQKNDIVFAYFIRPYENELRYIIDSDFNDSTRVGLDTKPITYDEYPWLRDVITERKAICSSLGNYEDDWDGLLTAYAPVFDEAGKMKAIAGVDIDDKDIVFARRMVVILTIVQIVAVLLVLSSGMMSLVYYRRERIVAEQAQLKEKNANLTKSKFLATVSHEIRTPMNAVIGMAELALRENMPADAREQVTTIKQASINLLSIINDILDFSKIESGKLEIVPTDYRFSSLMNDVVSIIRTRIVNSNMDFIVDIDSKIPDVLFGDATRIRQILLNLLSNAVKFTKEGNVSLSVNVQSNSQLSTLNSQLEDEVCIVFKVSDTGKGIKPEDIEKLFGDFVQVDVKNNKGIEGTGLGLAITKNLTKAMGGDISVSSEYGKGSVFTVVLPQKIGSSGLLDDEEYVAEMFSAPKARVLVVDDIRTNLKVAEGLMASYKMQIDLCASGAEAIETVKANHYDLIFMDHMMPEMDGIETAKRIRAMGCGYPIVALTANAVFGIKEMFIENGFNDFLSKPIDTMKLNAILVKWIPKGKQILAADAGDKNFSPLLQSQIQSLLPIFHKDAVQKERQLKECIEAENYSLYATHIHALKSAAANIGETELSELASKLEAASKQGDFAFVKRRNGEFLSKLALLIANIEAKISASAGDETEIDRELLAKLQKALEETDPIAIDEAMEALKAQNSGRAVEDIYQHILMSEYDEAKLIVNELLKTKEDSK